MSDYDSNERMVGESPSGRPACATPAVGATGAGKNLGYGGEPARVLARMPDLSGDEPGAYQDPAPATQDGRILGARPSMALLGGGALVLLLVAMLPFLFSKKSNDAAKDASAEPWRVESPAPNADPAPAWNPATNSVAGAAAANSVTATSGGANPASGGWSANPSPVYGSSAQGNQNWTSTPPADWTTNPNNPNAQAPETQAGWQQTADRRNEANWGASGPAPGAAPAGTAEQGQPVASNGSNPNWTSQPPAGAWQNQGLSPPTGYDSARTNWNDRTQPAGANEPAQPTAPPGLPAIPSPSSGPRGFDSRGAMAPQSGYQPQAEANAPMSTGPAMPSASSYPAYPTAGATAPRGGIAPAASAPAASQGEYRSVDPNNYRTDGFPPRQAMPQPGYGSDPRAPQAAAQPMDRPGGMMPPAATTPYGPAGSYPNYGSAPAARPATPPSGTNPWAAPASPATSAQGYPPAGAAAPAYPASYPSAGYPPAGSGYPTTGYPTTGYPSADPIPNGTAPAYNAGPAAPYAEPGVARFNGTIDRPSPRTNDDRSRSGLY